MSGAVQPLLGYGSSTPAAVWTARVSSFGTTLIRAVAYNGSNLFVAVGQSGKIATSPDAITWTQRTSSFSGTDDILCVTFGNALWVAGGTGPKIATSPDGITWTQRTVPASGATEIIGVAYGGGLYSAVSDDPGDILPATGNYFTSTNGTTWTERNSYANGAFTSLIFDGTDFVAGAIDNNTSLPVIAYSSDGINWNQNSITSFGFGFAEGLVYNGSNLYVVGDTESPGKMETSSSRIWSGTSVNPNMSGAIFGTAFGGGTYITVGQNGQASSSSNASSWTSENPQFGANNVNGVTFGAGLFVAVGDAGKLSTR